MGFSVILPTLNENGHIEDLINNISNIFENKQIDYEIIIVDDNSLDGTVETIKNMLKKNLYLKLIVRENKSKNLADSLNDGIKKSLFDNLIWMDADFQHPPKYIIKFIEGADTNDAIISHKFVGVFYSNTHKVQRRAQACLRALGWLAYCTNRRCD